MNDFLTGKGYKFYNGYEPIYQKRVESKSVCDLNEKLYITIYIHDLSKYGMTELTYSMKIRAEKNGLWWDIGVYDVYEKDLKENFDFLENKLVEMFNLVKVLK